MIVTLTKPVRWILGLLITLAAVASAHAQTGYQATLFQTPAWLQYQGNGSDGAYVDSNGTLGGEYQFTSFSVPSGDTLTVAANSSLTIRVLGTCAINGQINGSATFDGAASPSGINLGAVSGGGAGGSTAGAGAAGTGQTTSVWRAFIATGWGFDGQDVGGAYGGTGQGNTGTALGGAGVTLICGSITGTGTINVSGANGAASTGNNISGNGGGGGGLVILSSQITSSFAGLTINVAGGAGGSCGLYTGCYPGGAGSAGVYAKFSGW